MRLELEPMACWASIKSISFTEITDPLTIRAICGEYTMPMAIIALDKPVPRTAAITRASSRAGNANKIVINGESFVKKRQLAFTSIFIHDGTGLISRQNALFHFNQSDLRVS